LRAARVMIEQAVPAHIATIRIAPEDVALERR
jgi:hypothetical protein